MCVYNGPGRQPRNTMRGRKVQETHCLFILAASKTFMNSIIRAPAEEDHEGQEGPGDGRGVARAADGASGIALYGQFLKMTLENKNE